MTAGLLMLVLGAGVLAQTCGSELCGLTAGSEELRKFYQASGNQPVWLEGGRLSPRAEGIRALLRKAPDYGLDPAAYEVEFVPEAPVKFDVALTAALLRFASDLRFGRLDPGVYRAAGEVRAERQAMPELVRRRFLEAPDIALAAADLEPPFPEYRRVLEALRRYRELEKAGSVGELPTAPGVLEPGMTYEGLQELASRLRAFGDLAPGTETDLVYAGALVEAVKRFQERHGIEPDGKIGRQTLAALNTPVSRRVRQLELALERWRWLPRQFARPPLLVNIPEFRLRAYGSTLRPELELKVVVGRAVRRETPLLKSDLTYVIFRPEWRVPLSIQREELAPEILKDASYLSKNNFEVVWPDGKVTRGTPDPEVIGRLQTGEARLRQTPGPHNALGLVKFMFPNRHNVYLHDTPARSLFERSRRDFSHGCMRVERPGELAAWVLRMETGWSADRIHAAMNGSGSIRVDVREPIPVLIVYSTAVVSEAGEVRFRPDIYGEDAALARKREARGIVR